MAQEVAALVARLEADTRDFQKGLKAAEKRLKSLEGEGRKTRKGLKQTDSATKKLTNTVKGFAAAAGVAFATRAVVNFAKASITAASDLGESINAVEVVFGDAAEGIKSLGVESAKAVGLSNAEFNSLAVSFAGFVDKIAEGGGSVVGVMEELTVRASDFASVMNIDVAEAATIFRSGLAGETEPLRKFSIDLSAAAVNVKALSLGLAETSSELTEQDKILARYNLLMEQTEKTAGDFERTSGDLANATRTLTSTFTNAQAAIGDALIPAIEKLIPLAQEGIDLIIAWAIWLGRLTGAIDLVDASVRRAKLGIDEEATAIEFLFEAMRKLDLEFGGIDEKAPLGDLFANLITENSLAVELLSSRFDNLAETFGLTAEDAEFMRENAEELADEFKTTEDAVLGLADRLDTDLVEAMNNIAAKEGIKLLENTQDIRDAVLDGADAMIDGAEAGEDLAEGFKKIGKESRLAADGIARVRTTLQLLIDPAFALINASFAYEDALVAQTEVLDDATASERDRIEAGIASTKAFSEVMFAADAYAQVLDTDVATALRFMVDQGVITNETLAIMLGRLDEFDGFAGRASMELDYIERNRASLDRFLAINNDPGADIVSSSTPPFPTAEGFPFHIGGVVPGIPGTNVPAILQPGETVRTVEQERALHRRGGPGGGFFGGPGGGLFGGVGDVPGSISRSITAVANAVDHLFAATVSVFARAVSEFVDGLDRLTGSVSTVSTVIRQSNTVLDKEAVALDELSTVTKALQDVFGPGARNRFSPGFGSEPAIGLGPGGIGPRPIGGPGARIRFGPGGMAEPGVSGVPGSDPGGFGPGGFGPGPSGGPGAGGSGGSGEPGTTIIVQGFVGSELQLAAQIDKLLTRRSKTSKLGF